LAAVEPVFMVVRESFIQNSTKTTSLHEKHGQLKSDTWRENSDRCREWNRDRTILMTALRIKK